MNYHSSLTPDVTEKDHSQGSADAPVTLVEFGDFECPSCGEAYPILKRLLQHCGSGLRFVFRHYPLSQIHAYAHNAALAAEAASHFSLFWQMHDRLFENQQALNDEDLRRYAESIGIEKRAFVAQCKSPLALQRIRDNVASGNSSGVRGTPTFFINRVMYRGSYDLDSLILAVEAAKVSPEIPWH